MSAHSLFSINKNLFSFFWSTDADRIKLYFDALDIEKDYTNEEINNNYLMGYSNIASVIQCADNLIKKLVSRTTGVPDSILSGELNIVHENLSVIAGKVGSRIKKIDTAFRSLPNSRQSNYQPAAQAATKTLKEAHELLQKKVEDMRAIAEVYKSRAERYVAIEGQWAPQIEQATERSCLLEKKERKSE